MSTSSIKHQSVFEIVYSKLFAIDEKFYGLLAFLLPFFLYTFTTSRTITSYADSAELTTAAYNLDAAHPPGYPLFILLGKLFTLIPIGSIAFRTNLLSCAAAGLTIFVIFKIIRKLGLTALSSFTAVLVIAFSYSFWLYAITAEVYALNNLFAVSLIYLTLLWAQIRIDTPKQAITILYLIAFFFGLGLTNHLSLLILVPGIFYLIWMVDKSSLFFHLPKLGLLFLLGLLPYTFMIFAAAKPHYPLFGIVPDKTRLYEFITRVDYGGLLSAGPSENPTFEGIVNLFSFHLKLLFSRFTPLAPLLALYFVFVSLMRKQKVFIFLSILLIISTLVFPLFALRGATAADLHSQGVIERFSLLGQVILGIVFLVSLYALLAQSRLHNKEPLYQITTLLLALILLVSNFSNVNKRNYALAKNYALNILNQVEPGSIIFSSDDMSVFSLLYFVNVEHLKPDISLINTNFLENVFYQKEVLSYWPNLYQTNSIYSYDVARDIIKTNQGKRPIYFVMLKDPYPLGFDGNPSYLTPMGLVLKADTSVNRQSLETSSLKDYWSGYNLSGLDKAYHDPFASLAKYNYAFRAEVNTKIYLAAGCLPCAQYDIAAYSNFTNETQRLQDIISSFKPKDPKPAKPTAQDLLESAKQNLAKDTGGSLFYFHRAVWDLEQALVLDPNNQEAQALLTELMRSIGL